ncbi:MAG: DnaB family ATPase [Paraclostridium sp.]
MVDKSLHTSLLTTIVSDLSDRNFIGVVKKYFDEIVDPNEDEECTINILQNIVKYNITETEEAIFMIAGADYSEKILSGVMYDARYSRSYKNTILARLNMDKCVNKFAPYAEDILKCIDTMSREGGNKKGTMALETVYEKVQEFHKAVMDNKIFTKKSNFLLLDPNSENSNTLNTTAESMQISIKNRVKTLPVLDSLWGGGAIPGSLYLTGGISGFGKSLFMQNICLYACKNNNPANFITNGLQAAVVMFSYEMDHRQCFERTLSWLNVEVPILEDNESIVAYAERLHKLVKDEFFKQGIQIPIVYVIQDADNDIPDAANVEQDLNDLINNHGLFPIFVAVDYLDRMDIRNKRLRNMGESGAEGSAKTRLKARELRDVAKRFGIATLTATQLTGEAMAVIDRLKPYMKQFDPLQEFGLHMIAGSKNLRAEVEDVIMVHKIDIENKIQDGSETTKTSFLAISQEKDRDAKSKYMYSKRDRQNFHAYNAYTTQIKNSARRDLLKQTTKAHMVVPMVNFRISDEDYGLSIRMFYTSENSDFVSLSQLVTNSIGSLVESELEQYEDELFSMSYTPIESEDQLL